MFFKTMKKSKFLLALAFAFVAFDANSAVLKPQLDIQTLGSDTGVANSGGTLTIDATAIAIITNSTSVDIPDTPFFLTADYSSSSGSDYFFNNGSLTVGSLLTAEFANLTVTSLGGGTGVFSADLIYTGGDLQGNLTGGRIEGAFFNATSDDFSMDFSAADALAKVGAVVPVPMAVWLLGSGLFALSGLAIRRKNIS